MHAVLADLQLAWALLLCGLPVAAGYRFSRRWQAPLPAAADAILFAYLVQYLAVGLCGLAGLLTPINLTILVILFCAAAWMFSRGGKIPARRLTAAQAALIAAALAYAAGLLYIERYIPPLATDALAYHLPAAVQWLSLHRIGLFHTWFFNPANTYSPLAGSMFAAYLMAPLGNDAFARFMQLGPWLLIFVCMIQLCRDLGARPRTALLLAMAAALSRPILAQSVLAKDDLFVAGFFLAAVAGLSRLRGVGGACRVGVAVGLMLATKYTALFTLPLFLLVLDAPFRAGWRVRHWLIAAGIALLLPAPWYIRNVLLTGNPVFPAVVHLPGLHLPGLFIALRSQALATLPGFWTTLTGGYYSLPAILWFIWLAGWLAALPRWRLWLHQPAARLAMLGWPVGIAIFAAVSQFAELRYAFPAMLLLASCSAIALGNLASADALGAVVVAVAVFTGFGETQRDQIYELATAAAVCAAIALVAHQLLRSRLTQSLAAFACALWMFLNWPAYLGQYQSAEDSIWQLVYFGQADVWAWIDAHADPGDTIAYASQFMIYPLYGFHHDRRVMYVPIRPDLSLQTLRMPPRLTGEQIAPAADAAINRDADPAFWLGGIARSRARYLVVGSDPTAPETSLAHADPQRFRPVFRGDAATVYEILPSR